MCLERSTLRLALLAFLLGAAPAVADEPRVPMGKWLFEYDGRAAVGIGYGLQPMSPYSLATEVSATFRIGLEPWIQDEWTMVLMPEIGYCGFVSGEEIESNYFVTGVGIGTMWSDWFVLGLVPGVMAGEHTDRLGEKFTDSWGLRVSLVAELIYIIGVQATYQMVSYDNRMVPEFTLTGSLNLVPILAFVYVAGH